MEHSISRDERGEEEHSEKSLPHYHSVHFTPRTECNTPIHNIRSTAPQLSISKKALGTLPEGGNVMPKHVGATIHN
jgi:hypothetical protein